MSKDALRLLVTLGIAATAVWWVMRRGSEEQTVPVACSEYQTQLHLWQRKHEAIQEIKKLARRLTAG